MQFYFSQGRACSPIQPFSEFPWHFVPNIHHAVLWVVSSYGQDSYSFSDYYLLFSYSGPLFTFKSPACRPRRYTSELIAFIYLGYYGPGLSIH